MSMINSSNYLEALIRDPTVIGFSIVGCPGLTYANSVHSPSTGGRVTKTVLFLHDELRSADSLTPTERRPLIRKLVSLGHSNGAIGRMLGISVWCVEQALYNDDSA